MLDSTDPGAVREAMSRAESSLFILASKSGTTIEPNVMAAEAARRIEAAGHGPWGSRFVAITDENTALHRRALAERFRNIFLNPADIGGRYSALSFFGLVPASLMGVDLSRLLSPARAMADACRTADPRVNPGLALGSVMGAAARSGRSSGRKMSAELSLGREACAQPERAMASMKRYARPFPLLTPPIKYADRRMRNGLEVSN